MDTSPDDRLNMKDTCSTAAVTKKAIRQLQLEAGSLCLVPLELTNKVIVGQ